MRLPQSSLPPRRTQATGSMHGAGSRDGIHATARARTQGQEERSFRRKLGTAHGLLGLCKGGERFARHLPTRGSPSPTRDEAEMALALDDEPSWRDPLRFERLELGANRRAESRPFRERIPIRKMRATLRLPALAESWGVGPNCGGDLPLSLTTLRLPTSPGDLPALRPHRLRFVSTWGLSDRHDTLLDVGST
jgi:hypothetical protein